MSVDFQGILGYSVFMGVNRTYKDSVFSWLFSEPAVLRELYGAIEGVTLPQDVPININTLESVLFKGQMNDISFVIADTLVVLIEHQSTINENMPLRLLLYLAEIYKKITGDEDLYREKRISLPRPELIVLYNGTKPYDDEKILRLSNSFKDASFLSPGLKAAPELEVIAKVYNINQGRNESILRKCKTLDWYSAFIAKVREYKVETGDDTAAMKRAVKYCIEHEILKDFLKDHSTEVINMLLDEWNWDIALKVHREEAREEGREEGQNAVLELVRQGYTIEQIEASLSSVTKTAGK
ncbi:hypothetical protein FACS1894163_01640 [Spirochaetia bacterium]|nr:hypothetical protein FACS1894163_01640 [Spirochaetia bacterium]